MAGGTLVEDSKICEGGGSNNIAAQIISTVGGVIQTLAEDIKTALGFNVDSTNTEPSPLTPDNVLWGAAAAAMIGATLEEWRKKSQEEERQRAEAEAARKEEERKQVEERASLLAETVGEASANVWSVGSLTTRPTGTAPTTPGVLFGAAAAAYIATTMAEWDQQQREERLRRAAEDGPSTYAQAAKAFQNSINSFRDTLTKGNFSSDEVKKLTKDAIASGHIPSAKGMVEDRREEAIQALEKQQQENLAAMQKADEEKRKFEEELARQKAEEAAQQKALEDFRNEERASYTVTPVREEKSWWENSVDSLTNALISAGQKNDTARNLLITTGTIWNNYVQPVANTVGNFISGVAYQAIVRNNLDGLMTIVPAPKSVKDGWFQSFETLENRGVGSSTTAFKVGQVVGGLLGMAQGLWEIASGIATATEGTIVSCGTVVFCVGGGGASLAIGGALVADGVLVAGTSVVETGLQIQSLLTSAKKESEMKSYEDARRQGKIGEADHIDDGTRSDADFRERATGQRVDIKKPAPTWLNPLKRQVKNISDNIRRTTSETRFLIDLNNLSAEEKIMFKQQLRDLGTDMSRVVFSNE